MRRPKPKSISMVLHLVYIPVYCTSPPLYALMHGTRPLAAHFTAMHGTGPLAAHFTACEVSPPRNIYWSSRNPTPPIEPLQWHW